MVSFLHTGKEVLFMNEATANRVLRSALSQVVDKQMCKQTRSFKDVMNCI